MSEIKRIVVHCSDFPWGTVEQIRDWHVKGNKWRDIGYNFVIYNGKLHSKNEFLPMFDGRLVPGRHIDFNSSLDKLEIGAHTYGLNSSTIGIGMIGKYEFTPEQYRTLYFFYRLWKTIIPDIGLDGHNKFSKNGFAYTNAGKYQKYTCKKCGSNIKGKDNLFTKDKRKSLKGRIT